MVTSSASSTPVQSIEIFLPSRSSSSTQPVSMLNWQALASYFIILRPFCLTALLQWSVVLSYDKVWDVFRGKQWIRSVFRRTQKIRTLPLSEKSSDFVVVVHLQGLEPWTHWLRETDVQHSSIFRITQFRCFWRFVVILYFASFALSAHNVLSCICYPAIPVCKKCAKMCRAKISPWKAHLIFMQWGENEPVSPGE